MAADSGNARLGRLALRAVARREIAAPPAEPAGPSENATIALSVEDLEEMREAALREAALPEAERCEPEVHEEQASVERFLLPNGKSLGAPPPRRAVTGPSKAPPPGSPRAATPAVSVLPSLTLPPPRGMTPSDPEERAPTGRTLLWLKPDTAAAPQPDWEDPQDDELVFVFDDGEIEPPATWAPRQRTPDAEMPELRSLSLRPGMDDGPDDDAMALLPSEPSDDGPAPRVEPDDPHDLGDLDALDDEAFAAVWTGEAR